MSQRDDQRELSELERDLVAILGITPGLAAKQRRRDGLIAAIPTALLIGGLSTGWVQMDGPLWATGNADMTTGAAGTADPQAPSGSANASSAGSLATRHIESGQDIEPTGSARAEMRQPTAAKPSPGSYLVARDKPSKPPASRVVRSRAGEQQWAGDMPGERSRESYEPEYADGGWDDRDGADGYDDGRRGNDEEYRRRWRDEDDDYDYDRDGERDADRRRWRDEDDDYGRDTDRRYWRDEDRGYARGVDGNIYRRRWPDEDGG